MNRPYVLVTGNIGVGKSTLVEGVVSKARDAVAYYEVREFFLEEFYRNPEKQSFNLQLAYSLQFLGQALQINNEPRSVVQDRSIWDTHFVFSRWRHDLGYIGDIEFRLLERIVAMCDRLRTPDLVVFLDAMEATSLVRIQARGHSEEAGITHDFLAVLRGYYRRWYDALEVPKVCLMTDSLSPAILVERVIDAVPELVAPVKEH